MNQSKNPEYRNVQVDTAVEQCATPFDQPPGKVSDASFDVSHRKGAGAGTFLFFNLFTLLSRGRKSAKLGPPRSGITAVLRLWLLCTATELTGGRPRKV